MHRQPTIKDWALVIFRHDECIFKQYHMKTKSWVAPDGSWPIVPKDDGQGLMIFPFQTGNPGVGYKWWRLEKNEWE
jgi:hypothetical protein